MPSAEHRLDPTFFNPTLYNSILHLWFSDLPLGNKRGTLETARQWWGINRTHAESLELDNLCRENYAATLDSISPQKYPLPPYMSHESDLLNASRIAAPFLSQISQATTSPTAPETLLALTLLLDQIPRNIHRSPDGLALVYTHYDRLAYALIRSAPPHLLNSATFRGSLAHKQWLALPLMHAEELSSQILCQEYLRTCQSEAREDGDEKTVEATGKSLGFAKSHRDIIERFGRFPHRNQAVGRGSTEEEGVYLKSGGETFGVENAQ